MRHLTKEYEERGDRFNRPTAGRNLRAADRRSDSSDPTAQLVYLTPKVRTQTMSTNTAEHATMARKPSA